MNSIKAASVLSFFATFAVAWPTNTTSSAQASYACNPAHSYPEGVKCISTNDGLALVSPTASSTGYACNEAHSYPEGVKCISTNGGLSLVSPTAWTTSTVSRTDYVTVPCASPTVVTVKDKTITVTSATTLTVPLPTTALVTMPIVAGPSAAPSASASAASGCVAKYNTCRTTRVNGLSANQAQCASDNAACQGACYTAYNTCRSTRVNGLSANQAQCASEYAGCLGENPFGPDGSLTINPYSATVNSAAATTKPAQSNQASPASSAPVAVPSQPAASNGATCAPPQTVTVTQFVTVSQQQETPKAPSSAPVTTQKPSSSASASACATQLFDGCNPARSSCPNGPGTFITVTPSTYPTSYVVYGQTVSFTAAPTSCLPSSSATSSYKAASSALTSSKASGSAPAPSSTLAGKKCPLDLKAGSFEYPHGLQVNGVNGYNITVDRETKSNVVFDIPQADAGKTCNTYFSLPNRADLETSDYSLSLVDGAKINVSRDGMVVSSFTPQPNNAYLIESGKCAAGQAVTYTFSTGDSLSISLFNDYNPCALGAFITVA